MAGPPTAKTSNFDYYCMHHDLRQMQPLGSAAKTKDVSIDYTFKHEEKKDEAENKRVV
jgi:hypothetical protein